MSTLGQISTNDQDHAQQHVRGETSGTDPAHKGNETLVDGHGRREVRTVTENEMLIIRSQGVDLRCRAGIGGPRLAEASVGRWLTSAVAADYAVSRRVLSHRVRCNSARYILAAFERFLHAKDMPRIALRDVGEERGNTLSVRVLDAIHFPREQIKLRSDGTYPQRRNSNYDCV